MVQILAVLLLSAWIRLSPAQPLTETEVQEWSTMIFNGAERISTHWDVGRLFTFKERAVPVLRGKAGRDVVVAAAELGSGRVIAVSDKTLLKDFTKQEEEVDCIAEGDERGVLYTGKYSKTYSGRNCMRWTWFYPHFSRFRFAYMFPDDDMNSVANYCRNPDNDPNGPWCYTTDWRRQRESCNQIPRCPPKSYLESTENFHTGMKRWLTKDTHKGNDSVCYIYYPVYMHIPCLENPDVQIVVAETGMSGAVDPILDEKLITWIKNGGGFLFGLTSSYDRIPHLEVIFYNVILEAGIGKRYGRAEADERYVFKVNHQIDSLLALNLAHAASQISEIKDLDDPSDFLVFIIDTVIGDMSRTQYPWSMRKEAARHFAPFLHSEESEMLWPVCDSVTAVHADASPGIIRMFRLYANLGFLGLWNTKRAPNVHLCPGDLHDLAAERVDTEVEVYADRSQFWATGHYLAAGDEMTVTVLSLEYPSWTKFMLYIGMHTDDLLSSSPWKRYPLIHARIILNTPKFSVSSPFGGLVTIRSLVSEEDAYLKVKLSGVVKAPYYKLGDETSMKEWLVNRENPAPWGELEGEMITFYIPRKNLQVVDDPAEALRLWDEVVRRSYEFSAKPPTKRTRMSVIPDIQISVGVMHSGNPIMDRKDFYGDPTHRHFPMNLDGIENKFWGYYHEIGHNNQKKEWTFDGFTEVTVNLFSMLNREYTGGAHPWDFWWDEKISKWQIVDAVTSKSYSKTLRTPWFTLAIYTEIQQQFGWKCFKEVFEQYEYDKVHDPLKFPGGDNLERLNQWVQRLSTKVNYNLCPLFELWSYPVSVCDGKDTILASLQPFLPTDHVTEIPEIQQRVQEIKDQYTDLLRKQTHRPQCYIPTFDHKQQMIQEIQATTATLVANFANMDTRKHPSRFEKLSRIRVKSNIIHYSHHLQS